MTESNVSMMSLDRIPPRTEVACAQVVELYRDGYITLAAAKGLARTYGGDSAERILWHSVRRNGKGRYEKRV